MIIQLKSADKQQDKKDDSSIISQDNKKQQSGYYSEWPWLTKIKFALSTQGHALSVKEIIEVLTEYEPSLLFEQKRTMASVSSALSLNYGKGKAFIRFEGPAGRLTYNLSEGYPEAHIDDQLIKGKR